MFYKTVSLGLALAFVSVSSASNASIVYSTDDGDGIYPSVSKTCDDTTESSTSTESDTETWSFTATQLTNVTSSIEDGYATCLRASVYGRAYTSGDAAYATGCYEGTVDFYNGSILMGTYTIPAQCNYSSVDGDIDITGTQYAYFMLDGTDPSLGYSAVLNGTAMVACFEDSSSGDFTSDDSSVRLSLNTSKLFYGSTGAPYCPLYTE